MITPAKPLISALLLLLTLEQNGEMSRPTASARTASTLLAQPTSRVRWVYTLPPLLPAEIVSLSSPQPGTTKGRLQIGARRPIQPAIAISSRTVPATDWALLPDGSRTWSAQITSQGGLGIRVHFESLSLPAGARILLYNPAASTSQRLIITAEEVASQHDLWTGTMFGDRVLIECQVPAGADLSAVSFSVAEISHVYTLPATSGLKEGTCHNDVTCYPDWASEAAAVARISFIESGNTFLCTGCLLAPQVSTSSQFFLTANHCITSQTIASTLEFFWLYQTSSCDGAPPDLSSVPQTTGGADRLAGSSASDFAFLRLKHSAPGGVSFLSWSVDPPADGETLTCIHHPSGSFKRISFGHPYDSSANFWAVQWFSGVTEGGSSGSPLLNADHQVIGQLNGGYIGPGSSCSDPSAPDQFGRFDVTFDTVKRWLTTSSGGGGTGGGTDFTAAKGSYAGLFVDSSSDDPQHSSGLATITVSAGGKLSGKLTMGAQRLSMSGQLDSSGNAQLNINRRGAAPLTVTLQVDLSGDSGQISGTITDGSFNAGLTANRNLFNVANPAPAAGQYTLSLPGGDNGTGAPDGDGYAAITVDRIGRLKLSGSLADGIRLSQSTFVAADGSWPLYIPLYGGGGSVLGWMNFSGSDSLSGNVLWIRPGVSTAKYYPGGFTLQLAASGSRYTRPAPGSTILDLQNGEVVLSGGDLSQSVSSQFSLDARDRVTNLGPGKLTLSFSASNGTFVGRLMDPSTATMATFRGIVLQDQNLGAGYFLGPSQSGQVFVGPQ